MLKTYTSTRLRTLVPQILRDRDAEVRLVGRRGAGVELALVGVAARPGDQRRAAEDGVGRRVDDADVGAAGVRDGQVDGEGHDLAGRVGLHVLRVVAELQALAQPHVAPRRVERRPVRRAELRQPLHVRRRVRRDLPRDLGPARRRRGRAGRPRPRRSDQPVAVG